MGPVFIDQLKMRSSVLSLPVLSTALILLLQVHQDEATFALTISAGTGALALTAGQGTALAGLGVLAKLSGVVGGILLSRAGSRSGRQSRGRRYYRGKRSAEVEELEIDVTLNMLTETEPEQCFKRIICAAQTGKYHNPKLEGILSLINEEEAALRAGKLVTAAQYGREQRDVAKCEQRYPCSLDLEIIQTVF